MRDGVLGQGFRVLGRAIREEPRVFALGVGGSLLYGLLTVGGAYVIGYLVGHVVVPAFDDGRVTAGSLTLAAVVVLVVSALKVAGIVGRRLGAGGMQFRLQASYRARVTRRYLDLPLAWHHQQQTGALLSAANADIEAAWQPVAPLPFAVGTVAMMVGAVGALFATDWALALVGVALFPTLFSLNVAYSRRMSPRVSRAQRLRAELSAIAHESFDGALVVKSMGREADETARFAVKAAELRDALIAVGRMRGGFDPVLDALPSLGTLAVLLVGAVRLRSGAVTVTEVVSVAFLFTVLAFPVRAIGWVLAELPRSVAGWQRVRRVLDATGDVAYGSQRRLAGPGPVTVTFDQVSFGYSDDAQVLDQVSFEVPAGRTVALVGATGSGKSTIAALAVRLVDPVSGSVRLDGQPLADLSAAELASTVALVPQLSFVFDDTVRGNVALDRDGVDDAQVLAALRLARAESFVDELPGGVDAEVGERGVSLSGGQRQRLTLARGLAGRPGLLVLDDATSAVDPRVESDILAGLRQSRATEMGATVLVVAHRVATIALADEVVYLERGRVVAQGTHVDLVRSTPGYANLVTAYERDQAERDEAERDEAERDQAERDQAGLDQPSFSAARQRETEQQGVPA